MENGKRFCLLVCCILSCLRAVHTDEDLSGLKCSDNILIKVNQPLRTQVCQFERHNVNISNVSISATINRLKSFCENAEELPIIQQKSLSEYRQIFTIVFKNASQENSGIFAITFRTSTGVTSRRNISISVADVPATPDERYYPCQEDGIFCFIVHLPKKQSCNVNISDSYWFNYTSVCMGFSMSKLKCDVINNTADYRVLKCKDSSINICKSVKFAQCWFHIQIFGYNEIGSSNVRHLKIFSSFMVPRDELVVTYLQAKAISSNQLRIMWSRPNCSSMTYIYKLTYEAIGSNLTQQKDAFLPHYPDDNSKRSTVLDNLKPFKTYRTCLLSMLDTADLHYRQGACAVSQTLEAMPSKAPVITGTFSQKIDDEHWNCKLLLEAVDKKYWNGRVDNVQLELRQEKIPDVVVKTLNITVSSTEYTVRGLNFNKRYFVQLKICTRGGCKKSERKLILLEKSKKKHNWNALILGLVLVIVACSCFIGVYFAMKRRRYKKLQNTGSIVTIAEIDQVQPREYQHHPYEEISDDYY